MREDVIGRANVEDTPELQAYYKDLEKHEAAALWTVANEIEPWQPQSASVPVLWKYRDLRAHVLRSVQLVSAESVSTGRSAISSAFRPGPGGMSTATPQAVRMRACSPSMISP
jgi:gentisate 1,2-dioxygenase